MPDIYFFSRHSPDPKMLADLPGPISYHITGTVKHINAGMSHEETTVVYERNNLTYHVDIPKNAIVIVVGSPHILQEFAAAKFDTLLMPAFSRKTNGKSIGAFHYIGLKRIIEYKFASEWYTK